MVPKFSAHIAKIMRGGSQRNMRKFQGHRRALDPFAGDRERVFH